MSATTASAVSAAAMKSPSVGSAAAPTLKRKTPSLPAEETTKETWTARNKEASTWSEGKGSHILKLKKEAFASRTLWREMRDSPGGMRRWLEAREAAFASRRLWREMRDSPGGMRRWLEAREAAARAEETQPSKKRKKVVKTLMTPKFMEMLRARGPPRTVSDMSDEMLSRKPESYRREYAIRKYIDARWGEYLRALVEQYNLLGYAEDEDELTDDEDDDAR